MSIIYNSYLSLKTKFSDRRLNQWCANHSIKFTNRRLVIKGLLVSEFNYLLKHYSDSHLSNFENFEQLAILADDLLVKIDEDQTNPKEHTALGVGLATARANMTDLRAIIQIIQQYVAECRVHGRNDRITAGASYGCQR